MSPLELLETQVIEYDLPRPIPHTVVSDCTIFEMLGSELGASYILGKYSFTEVVPGLFYYFILFFYMRVCVCVYMVLQVRGKSWISFFRLYLLF